MNHKNNHEKHSSWTLKKCFGNFKAIENCCILIIGINKKLFKTIFYVSLVRKSKKKWSVFFLEVVKKQNDSVSRAYPGGGQVTNYSRGGQRAPSPWPVQGVAGPPLGRIHNDLYNLTSYFEFCQNQYCVCSEMLKCNNFKMIFREIPKL